MMQQLHCPGRNTVQYLLQPLDPELDLSNSKDPHPAKGAEYHNYHVKEKHLLKTLWKPRPYDFYAKF